MSRFIAPAVVLFLTALALFLRVPQLGNRPFHADESVHAVKFRALWESGRYVYDPNEFHGPTIYYSALPIVNARQVARFADLTEADLRLSIAILGASLVPLLWLLRTRLSAQTLLWSGLFLALSPAFVFYSRYFIQEVFLVVFTLGFLGCAARGWAVGAGAFVGLMFATKETAVLSLAAAALAWALTLRSGKRTELPRKPLVLASGVALLVGYLVLSGFLSYPAGPLGYVETYLPWLGRAGGTDLHRHPWHYYLSRLLWHSGNRGMVWSEALILLLGMVGAFLGRREPYVRFLAVYTATLTMVYAAIPYKTPWCLLNFLLPWALLAGHGVAGLVALGRVRPVRYGIAALALLGAAQLGQQAYRTGLVLQNDSKNPYAYSPTVPDIEKLKTQIDALGDVSPLKENLVIQVIAKDDYYWPLPWYLRRFDKIGYYRTVPEAPYAPVVLAAPEFDEALTPRLSGHIMVGIFAVRPDTNFELFIDLKLWEAYLKKRGPVVDERDENWVPPPH